MNTFMGKGAVSMNESIAFTRWVLVPGTTIIWPLTTLILLFRAVMILSNIRFISVESDKPRWEKIIHIDFWEAEVDKDYQPDVEVVGDLADALWQLRGDKRH